VLCRGRIIYVDMMLTNYKLWIPAQAVNFFFVPVHYQVLASNFIALVWNTYMSYINSKKREPLAQ
jgi:protein Mpv17